MTIPTPDKTCPECDSSDYRFRGRRAVNAKNGAAVETKYACAACGHQWKVRVAPECRAA